MASVSNFKPGDRVRVYVRNDLHCATNGRHGTVTRLAEQGRWVQVALDNDRGRLRLYVPDHLEPAPPEAS